MAASTSSTTAVNGSADEFAPSSSPPPPRTPEQVEEDTALATRRCEAFMDDTSVPAFTTAYTNNHQTTIPSRTQEAAANIHAFDAVFDNGNNNNNSNNDNNEDNGGQRGNN